MFTLSENIWLLAVRRQGMGGGFRGENNQFDVSQMLVVVAVLASISAVLFLLDRWIRRRIRLKTYESPTELFRQLCRTHELDRSARRLLQLLASQWKLANPASLFVEPDYFRPEKLPADWYDRAPQLELLHRQLFEAL
ncbi:MAG TPA: hypothetical protein VGM76_19150 [Lacipirellulaceae bacterium]|jgi:hypothetical protein